MIPETNIEAQLSGLDHVGIVVFDLEAAMMDFERRWRAQVTDVKDVALVDALYHGRATSISYRRGVICSNGAQIELIQPLSESPFRDFLNERKGDGVHHLAYRVANIDPYLARLKPTGAELALDCWLPETRRRVICVDGFAHGPAIELIQTGLASGGLGNG